MRTFSILSLFVFPLALSGCAAIQSGVVWQADPWGRTLTIGQETYRVTSDTDLYGQHGEPIVFDEIPTFAKGGIGVRDLKRAEVEFFAHEQSGELYLESLRVRSR